MQNTALLQMQHKNDRNRNQESAKPPDAWNRNPIENLQPIHKIEHDFVMSGLVSYLRHTFKQLLGLHSISENAFPVNNFLRRNFCEQYPPTSGKQ
jgi:hypothetical protein